MRALIQLRDLSLFQKFLTLLAGRVGQVLSLASLGNDAGASATAIRNWLAVLKASYVVFELPPFFENVKKRVIKSPKIYFTDVGLAAFLFGIHTAEQASRDPLRGNLYENLVIADIVKSALNRGIRPEVYFFRDSHGNEIDLIIREKGMLSPVEIKSAATFQPSSSSNSNGSKRWASSASCPARFSITASGPSTSEASAFSIPSTWKTSGRR